MATPPDNHQNADESTRPPPPRPIVFRPQPTTTHGGGVKRPRIITTTDAAVDPVVTAATSSRQRPPSFSIQALFYGENSHGESLSSSESESESEAEEAAVAEPTAAGEVGTAAGGYRFFMKDVDVLDCPICTNPLTIPVFQCENGHITCTDCCLKLKNKCPSCSRPIGQNRNRAVEKIIESVQVPCCNWNYGCKEMIAYNNKHEHNLMCIHAPCSCPNSGCNFVGSLKNLGHHCMYHQSILFRFDTSFYLRLHKHDMHVILVEADEKNVFVVNHARIAHGGIVDVDCIAPVESKMRFSYTLSAVNAGMSIQFKSFAENVSKWIKHVPQRQFLVVPCDWYGQAGEMRLDVCIKKDDAVSVV